MFKYTIKIGKTDDKKLITAVKKDNTKKALKLIAKMDDVSQQNNNGETALMWAAYNDNAELAKELIAKMDDVSQQNNYGETALFWAVKRGNKEIEEAIKLKQGDYETTLLHLLKQGKDDKAKALVEAKNSPAAIKQQAIEQADISSLEKILTGSSLSSSFNELSTADTKSMVDSLRKIADNMEKSVAQNDNKPTDSKPVTKQNKIK